jgi:aldehyde dehydrogenase (NAD+)
MWTRDSLFIGGEWASPAGKDRLEVISPITESVVGSVPLATTQDVDVAVRSARDAFEDGEWTRLSPVERGAYLQRIVEILAPRLEEMAHLQVDEMGSPYSFISRATGGIFHSVDREIEAVAKIPAAELRDGAAGKVLVRRRPIGVVAAIIPWNAPVPLVISRMIPVLLTGCTLVLKPAPETPLSAYIVAEAAEEAGLPKGVFSIVAGGRDLGEYLISHPGIDRVTFTGSSAAGARVASVCGEHLKLATMELGGKSAGIILEDCDLDARMPALLDSSLPNNGQVCYATTRLLVPQSRASEIVERLVATVGEMKVGDPHEADTAFGPLVAERQRQRVEGYIASGREQGAKVVLGGGRPSDRPTGWYVEPTIFTNVTPDMRIAREEIFGPVLSVLEYATEDDAVALANDSEFGLGGGVFTEDVEHAIEIAGRIQTGTCRINEAPPGGGGEPFGGCKRSGVGRERGREGYEGYWELQSIALPAGYVPAVEAQLVSV